MIINFRAYKISRGTRNMVRTPTLINKKKYCLINYASLIDYVLDLFSNGHEFKSP